MCVPLVMLQQCTGYLSAHGSVTACHIIHSPAIRFPKGNGGKVMLPMDKSRFVDPPWRQIRQVGDAAVPSVITGTTTVTARELLAPEPGRLHSHLECRPRHTTVPFL